MNSSLLACFRNVTRLLDSIEARLCLLSARSCVTVDEQPSLRLDVTWSKFPQTPGCRTGQLRATRDVYPLFRYDLFCGDVVHANKRDA